MMHKHAITLHKPLPQTDTFVLHFLDAVARLRDGIKIEIPTDHQDKGASTGASIPPEERQLSQHTEIRVGEYSIKQSVQEVCDRCGEIKPMQNIELQGRQFLCRNCRDPQPSLCQMPKMVRQSD
jgi:hypothetical protein